MYKTIPSNPSSPFFKTLIPLYFLFIEISFFSLNFFFEITNIESFPSIAKSKRSFSSSIVIPSRSYLPSFFSLNILPFKDNSYIVPSSFTTNKELDFVCKSLHQLSENIEDWAKDYKYDTIKNDYTHKTIAPIEKELVTSWFAV